MNIKASHSYKYLLPLVLLILAGFKGVQLSIAATEPVGAYFVLGGSPCREIYAARLAQQHPAVPVLISSGSAVPCIFLMFKKLGVPVTNVWVEQCARNTFENFYFSVPIIKRWGVKKVLLITDQPQIQRALPMARYIFGANGIWVEVGLVPEVLGDYRSEKRIFLGSMLAACWSVVSQFYDPPCSRVTRIADVDMERRYRTGFDCQQQTGVDSWRPKSK